MRMSTRRVAHCGTKLDQPKLGPKNADLRETKENAAPHGGRVCKPKSARASRWAVFLPRFGPRFHIVQTQFFPHPSDIADAFGPLLVATPRGAWVASVQGAPVLSASARRFGASPARRGLERVAIERARAAVCRAIQARHGANRTLRSRKLEEAPLRSRSLGRARAGGLSQAQALGGAERKRELPRGALCWSASPRRPKVRGESLARGVTAPERAALEPPAAPERRHSVARPAPHS